jgi:hypothetical protein
MTVGVIKRLAPRAGLEAGIIDERPAKAFSATADRPRYARKEIMRSARNCLTIELLW